MLRKISFLILFSLLSFHVFAQVEIREIAKRECDSLPSLYKEVNLESQRNHFPVNVGDNTYFFQTESEFRVFIFKHRNYLGPGKDTVALICPDFKKYDVVLIGTSSNRDPDSYKVLDGKDHYIFNVYYLLHETNNALNILSQKEFLIPKGKHQKLPEVNVYETWKKCD